MLLLIILLFRSPSQPDLNLVIVNNEVLFFNFRDGPYFPTLRILHKFPTMMPQVQVDRGAIKHVLQGANVMTPGLTSKGGKLPAGIPKGAVVVKSWLFSFSFSFI